jgi:outer membrane protein assembly factor BamB
MRDYDRTYYVIVVGNSVYFSSSADDSVHCLDAQSGKPKWTFTADGPVRIAPEFSNGRIFFGSDDGCAYCIDAANGTLIWKSAPQTDDERILNNGRFISRLPCRTGVIVEGTTAYYGLAMLPWRESYLCAVDVRTGKPTGVGRYVNSWHGETFEGALLASAGHILAPRGRVSPMLFDKETGKRIGALQGGGGSKVTISRDGRIMHGPGNKTGWVTVSHPQSRKPIRTHNGLTTAVSDDKRTYLLASRRLVAVSAHDGKPVWSISLSTTSYELVAAGNALLVGGRNELAAYSVVDGKRLWQTSIDGDVYGLAVAGGALYASTHDGTIHCYRPQPGQLTETKPGKSPQPDKPTSAPAPTGNKFSRALVEVQDPALLDRWVFHSNMASIARRRGLSNAGKRVANLSKGLHASVLGNLRLRRVGGVEAMEFDGATNSVLVTDDHRQSSLPQRQMTVEAWVRVDRPLKWGGIVGVVQDNGDFERGWLLGYSDSRFSFAIAGEKGPGRLTYLAAENEFQNETWYHVVGTYDGAVQRVYVNGKLEQESAVQKGDIKYPPRAYYEIGAYHDEDENFRMTGMLHEVRVYSRALSAAQIKTNYDAKRSSFPVPIRLATGPFAQFSGLKTAVVRWTTSSPSATRLEFIVDGELRQIAHESPKTSHRALLSGLKRNSEIAYRVQTVEQERRRFTPWFPLETDFNYSLADVPGGKSAYPQDEASSLYAAAADRILTEAKIDRGLCLVLGSGKGRLAYELARRSKLRVIGIDTDKAAVDAARQTMQRAGIYGTRVAFHAVSSYDRLPFIDDWANLIVSDRLLRSGVPTGNSAEMIRMLRPGGGVALLGQPRAAGASLSQTVLADWIDPAPITVTAKLSDDENGVWAFVVRKPVDGAGEWSHLYGRADNSAFGGETLGGVSTATGMRVKWIGRPGPRAQPDRNGRKPSPLSVNGRLFVQGLHRLIGLDAHNGTPLWSLEIPSMERFNMPRDCGNWCADDDTVFAAIRDKCWQIDAQTGRVMQMHNVLPGTRDDWKYDWGYVARVGDQLLGSAVKQGTAYTNFWGDANAGWYDARSGPATFKVCSDSLFALDAKTGVERWTYRRGVILNSTITATTDTVYFVECRNKTINDAGARRVGSPELWRDQFLVALDTATGKTVWEQSLAVEPGIVVFYMAYADGRLVINSSNNKRYDVYAFDATNGKSAWHQTAGWPDGKGDHGKAMSRPAIVGGSVYVRPSGFDLKTGKLLSVTMPAGGCGTYAATTRAFIFRSGNVTLWDHASGSSTSWDRMRPGCWLSTIPAGGMLLSPEAGGGCSCGSWIETSIGFIPGE